MRKIWLGGQAWLVDEDLYWKLEKDLNTLTAKGEVLIKDSENWFIKKLQELKLKPITVSVVLLLSFIQILLYVFGDNSGDFQTAQLLTTLITGAGVNTITPAAAQIENDILIGTVDTAMPLQGIKVNIDGDTTIDVQNSVPLVSALAKITNLMVGSGIIGLIIRVATGRIICKAGVITFTNGGATTPSIFSNSNDNGGPNGARPIRAKTTTINPLSNQTFNGVDFGFLCVTNPANINSFDFTFTDGTQQNMTPVEADAFFCRTNEAQATGRLDAVVTTIDNRLRLIDSVRINVGATAVTVMWVK